MESELIKILVVEDSPAFAQMTRATLVREASRFAVEHVTRIDEAIALLTTQTIDVVLLDLTLPDAEGIETFRRLAEAAPDVPVVILTGLDDEALAMRAVQEGAQDYLRKRPEDLAMLGRALRYAMERHRMQIQLRALALVDELTGLYNRRGFLTIGEHDLQRAMRADHPVTLLFADLDGLKEINDSFGHVAGDRAIRDAADVIRASFRRSDVTARMGGDEFAILIGDASAGHGERLAEEVERHNRLENRPYTLSLSVGTAVAGSGAPASLQGLVASADAQMYASKMRRRGAGPGYRSRAVRNALIARSASS